MLEAPASCLHFEGSCNRAEKSFKSQNTKFSKDTWHYHIFIILNLSEKVLSVRKLNTRWSFKISNSFNFVKLYICVCVNICYFRNEFVILNEEIFTMYWHFFRVSKILKKKRFLVWILYEKKATVTEITKGNCMLLWNLELIWEDHNKTL